MPANRNTLTKAQLIIELSTLRQAYERLDAEHQALQARHAAPKAPPAAQRAAFNSYREALAAAREEAKRTGRCVKVS